MSKCILSAFVVAAVAVAIAAVTAGAKVSGTNGRIAYQKGNFVLHRQPRRQRRETARAHAYVLRAVLSRREQDRNCRFHR